MGRPLADQAGRGRASFAGDFRMIQISQMAFVLAAGMAVSLTGAPQSVTYNKAAPGAQAERQASQHAHRSADARHHQTPAHALSAADAYDLLVAGNQRWVSGESTNRNTGAERMALTASEGQEPFATILACSDSRVPIERVFDRGVGDLFVVRVAGNVCDTDEVGSVEYGVAHLGTPVLVILGHSACGAVTAVAQGAKVGPNIQKLVDNIEPAVAEARRAVPDAGSPEFLSQAVAFNAFRSIHDLFTASPDTCRLVEQGRLKVVAAVYNLGDGTIEWLGEHPRQSELIARGLGGGPASAERPAIGSETSTRQVTVPDRGQ